MSEPKGSNDTSPPQSIDAAGGEKKKKSSGLIPRVGNNLDQAFNNIGALVGAKVADVDESSESVRPIDVNVIDPNPYQSRTHFDTSSLFELSESITAHGVLQPIIVRPHPTIAGRFQIVAGERRLRAAKLAELGTIPCVVRIYNDYQMHFLCLVENLAREDPSDYEFGMALADLMRKTDETKTHIAEEMGIARSQVYRLISFDELPQVIHDLLKRIPSSIGATAAEKLVYLIRRLKERDISDEAIEVQLVELTTKLEMGLITQATMPVLLEEYFAPTPESGSNSQGANSKSTGEKINREFTLNGNLVRLKLGANGDVKLSGVPIISGEKSGQFADELAALAETLLKKYT